MESDERALNVRYRLALLPHLADLRHPEGGLDLNLCEEVLSRAGLRDLNRAERVMRGLV
jgi:hypothetical protein